MITVRFKFQAFFTEYCVLLLLLPCLLLANKAIPPKILQKIQGNPEKSTLTMGKRYQQLCTVSEGDLPITIRWMKNGQSVTNSQDISVRRLDDYSSSLVIQSVDEYHTGNYSCVVSNAVGMDSFTVKLQINVEPQWVQQPVDTKVVVNSEVALPCQASGNPEPVISWKKSRGMASDQLRDVNGEGRIRVTQDGSLSISRTESKDEGFYVCIAGNKVGKDLKKTVKLDILVPPQVIEKYRLLTERSGQWAFFNCSVIGDKPMTISWKRNGQPLDPASDSRVTLNEVERDAGLESALMLGTLTSSDSGLFVCTAENPHGRTDVRFRLVVVEVPGPPRSLSLVRAWSRSIQVGWETPDMGNSPITKYVVEYRKEKEERAKVTRKEFRASDNTAVLDGLVPWTRYRIWVAAENVVGFGQLSDPLVVQTSEEEPSATPSNFRIEMVRATTARLSWQHLRQQDWNGQILGYYVGYKGYDENSPFGLRSIPLNDSGSGQSYVLSGLQKVSSYKVVVNAFNSAGSGPSTDPLTFQTKSGVPPNTPKIRLLLPKETLCEVQIEPDTYEDEIEDYILHVKRHHQQGPWEELPLSSTGVHLVGGLNGDTHYQMFVTARNPFGASEPSQVMTFHTSKPSLTDEGESLWEKPSVVLPTAASVLLVLVVCCVTCCMARRLTRPPKREGVAANDFSYTRPTTSRSESACFYSSPSGGSIPAHMQHRPPASLPRTARAAQAASQYSEPRPCTPKYEEPKYECVVEEMKTFIGAFDRRSGHLQEAI